MRPRANEVGAWQHRPGSPVCLSQVRELRLLPNPIADKKVLKVLNADRPEKVVKELFKLLEAGAGSGGKKGGRR